MNSGGRIANKTQPNCHIDLESTLWDKKSSQSRKRTELKQSNKWFDTKKEQATNERTFNGKSDLISIFA